MLILSSILNLDFGCNAREKTMNENKHKEIGGEIVSTEHVCNRCTASYQYKQSMCRNCRYTSFSVLETKAVVRDKVYKCNSCGLKIGQTYLDEQGEQCDCGGDYEFLTIITGDSI